MDPLVAPDALRSSRQRTTQPWSASDVKERLVVLACQSEAYVSEDLNLISAANPGVANDLLGKAEHVIDSSLASLEEPEFDAVAASDIDCANEPNAKRSKLATSVELTLSILIRCQNIHVLPFLLVCLTLMLLKTGASHECWSILTYMHVAYSREWMEDFCKRVSDRIARDPPGTHEGVKFCVFDNCSYREHTTYQGADSNGGLLHTVNWLRVPLAAAQFPLNVVRGMWHNGSRRFKVRRWFSPSNSRPGRFKMTVWMAFIALALNTDTGTCGNILRRPTAAAPEESHIIYMPPELDIGTAKYADIDHMVQVIDNYYFHAMLPASMVLAVGDQQSYHRLFWQKKYHQKRYNWLLPLPGEFHFTVHALMAIHKLWYRSLSQKVVEELRWQKTVKEDWTSVEEWHHYDRFYQLLIWGLTAFLVARVPRHILQSPEQLMQRFRGNATMLHVVRFLYDFGFPYLRLRNAIRCNDHEIIDLMWIITYAASGAYRGVR